MKTIFSAISVATAIALSQPAIAQITYPVPFQADAYRLKTQISPAQNEEFSKIFTFGSFDPNKAIALRAKLLPLAQANDPLACFWLARTYDWDEFGVGKDSDRPIALKWYRQAAKSNFFTATYFLYQAYSYGFVGVKVDYKQAIAWLNKSLEVSTGAAKSRVLSEFARLSSPDADPPSKIPAQIVPRSKAKELSYLKQAFEITPRDTWIVDYYGSLLYEAKRYTEALMVRKNSDNAYTWQDIGRMYEKGEGTKPDINQALFWYKKMAIEGKKQENDLNPIPLYGRQEIYRLICLKKITPQQAAPLYVPEEYKQLFGSWNKECSLSG
jgi:TPR repeat protein